jgi:hypothetical protein
MIFYPSPTKILNPLNDELNPNCHLLALLALHILHVSSIRVKRNQGVLDLHQMWRMKKGKRLTIPLITVSQGASTNQSSVMEIQ